ncbi:MAG: hypothetical protein GY940_09115 [bacterium]|nr:hypothetical protein [bacterium]
MKNKLVVVLIVIVAVFAASFPVIADSAEDYKVIKRAAKNKKAGDVVWFKVQITDKKTKKNKVKITIPIALIDLVMDSIDEKIKINGKKDLDFKKIFKALKKHGPMAMIEVDEEDALIKVWLE